MRKISDASTGQTRSLVNGTPISLTSGRSGGARKESAQTQRSSGNDSLRTRASRSSCVS